MMIDSTPVDTISETHGLAYVVVKWPARCAAGVPTAAHRYFTRSNGDLAYFPCGQACDVPLSNNPAVQMVAFMMAGGTTDEQIGWPSVMEFAASFESDTTPREVKRRHSYFQRTVSALRRMISRAKRRMARPTR